VRVQLGKRKGKVMIEFATLDDLQRICDAIGLDRAEVPDTVPPPASAAEDRSVADEPQVLRGDRATEPASV
jgi:hypothetical protein